MGGRVRCQGRKYQNRKDHTMRIYSTGIVAPNPEQPEGALTCKWARYDGIPHSIEVIIKDRKLTWQHPLPYNVPATVVDRLREVGQQYDLIDEEHRHGTDSTDNRRCA